MNTRGTVLISTSVSVLMDFIFPWALSDTMSILKQFSKLLGTWDTAKEEGFSESDHVVNFKGWLVLTLEKRIVISCWNKAVKYSGVSTKCLRIRGYKGDGTFMSRIVTFKHLVDVFKDKRQKPQNPPSSTQSLVL